MSAIDMRRQLDLGFVPAEQICFDPVQLLEKIMDE
jgi:hypothetical protein